MEIKHTPGPWRISGYNENMGYPEPVIAGMVNGCTAYVAVCIECQGMDDANARLIAAAPELLEALIEVTATLAWNAHGECRAIHDGPIMPSSQAIEVARAAIAKAKGEEQ